MLNIIRAGMYTSVQDGGRHSFRQSGISHCGALDKPALNVANLLVGNDANAAALEITLGQLVVEFETDGWFALTGAGCEAHLDRTPVWSGWRLPVKAGQRLTLKRPHHGMRSYLAVAGGFDVPEVMGSRSTDLKVGIGGLEGRLLRDGDRLAIGASTRQFSGPQGVKQLMWATTFVRSPGLNTRSLTKYRRLLLALPVAAESAKQPYGVSPAGAVADAHDRSRAIVAWFAPWRSAGSA